jgi:hypothetical protein
MSLLTYNWITIFSIFKYLAYLLQTTNSYKFITIAVQSIITDFWYFSVFSLYPEFLIVNRYLDDRFWIYIHIVFLNLFGKIKEVISLKQLFFKFVLVTYLLFTGLVAVVHFLLFPLFLLKGLDDVLSINIVNMSMRWCVLFTGTDNIIRHPFSLFGNHQFLFQLFFDILLIKSFKRHLSSYFFGFNHSFVILLRYVGMSHSNCLRKSRLMVPWIVSTWIILKKRSYLMTM